MVFFFILICAPLTAPCLFPSFPLFLLVCAAMDADLIPCQPSPAPTLTYLEDNELLNTIRTVPSARELTLKTSQAHQYCTMAQISVLGDESPYNGTPKDALNDVGLRIYNAARAQLGDGSNCTTLRITQAVFLPEKSGMTGASKRPLGLGVNLVLNNLTNVVVQGRVAETGGYAKCGPLVMWWLIKENLYGALTCAGELVLAEMA